MITKVKGSVVSADGINCISSGFIGSTTVQTALAEIGSKAVSKYNGLTALRNTTPVDSTAYYLAYHTSEGDGGHGVFRGVSGMPPGTYVDDNGITIVPTGGDGSSAFIREYDGAVSVRWFGAQGDGSTDDTAAIQAAIDSVQDYIGARVYIPPNTAIASSITIENKKGLILFSDNGQGFGFVGAPYIPTLKWIGAAGGTMLTINNCLNLTMSDMVISGENSANYGMAFYGLTSGWGVSNYNNLVIVGCKNNAVLKTENPSATLKDFGRNHWVRCTFRKTEAASGTEKNDAIFVYDNDSGVQDVFDHCEFIYTSSGTSVTNTYALWFEAGTPRVHLRDCYTKAENGIFTKSSGATPKFYIYGHYSEDDNFISLPNSNTRQVLENCVHANSGGVSVTWGGASGGGAPLVIDGGEYAGTLSLNNQNAPVVFSNSPQFLAGYPTVSDDQHLIVLGRSQGSAVAATESHGAINASAFVPFERSVQTTVNIYASLNLGSIFAGTLQAAQNSVIPAPTGLDANGLDVGREIEYRLIGHATSGYNALFNAVFKLAGGSYTHSGAGKTDIIAFRWDGTYWWETRRSMNM